MYRSKAARETTKPTPGMFHACSWCMSA